MPSIHWLTYYLNSCLNTRYQENKLSVTLLLVLEPGVFCQRGTIPSRKFEYQFRSMPATKTVLVCTGVAFALSVWYLKKTSSSLSSPALKQKSPKSVNKENTVTKAPPHNASVSAPGKVLVAGGYTVLEQPNVGLVLASTARFHTDINSLPISQSMVKSFVSPIKRRNSTLSPTKSIPSSTPNSIPIQLNSPQFKSIYHFMLNFHPSNECLPTLVTTSTNLSNAAKNPYIETTLIVAFSYCQSVLGCEKFSKIFNENCKNDFVEVRMPR